ncbi:MAG: MBL fold metallo-hydrolase, partial [Candidatus Rokubacteria bacterium]|nr:MBL fold metallo-hydrolase [Candidatus Rokubacteria bacterium]
EVWGCRGSRSFVPRRSAIANHTSCYSILHGPDLLVLDAGRGLLALGSAVSRRAGFRGIRRVHVLVSHAHLDHWEGLKDAEWFWGKELSLEVTLLGTPQALRAIRGVYGHPFYVSLELLAAGTMCRVSWEEIEPGDTKRLGGFEVRTEPLYHYSGDERAREWLDTLGFRATAPDGATVAYLSDHEPHQGTREIEGKLLDGAHLAVYDAHWLHARHHAHGHGSQEHAAGMASAFPRTLVLAGHHGPSLLDPEIRAAHRRHGRAARNFRLAVEGEAFRFDRRREAFVARHR